MRYFSKDALKEAMGRVMRSDTDTAYSVTGDPKVLTFPFPETGTGTSYPAVGAFWTLRAGSKQHTVGFCRRIDLTTDCWFPICGPSHKRVYRCGIQEAGPRWRRFRQRRLGLRFLARVQRSRRARAWLQACGDCRLPPNANRGCRFRPRLADLWPWHIHASGRAH